MTDTSDKLHLPQELRGLADLAWNLWWSWNENASQLFWSINPEQWDSVGHNPVKLLREISNERMEALSNDDDFLQAYEHVTTEFSRYMERQPWSVVSPKLLDRPVAYFSMEYGLHESLPIYAGGLGILSGDYLKEASDIGLPIVAVGLFYRRGYFDQEFREDGRQATQSISLDPENLPLHEAKGVDGKPATIQLDFPDRPVVAKIWKVQVGRVPLYLLDTAVPNNHPDDRPITSRLYPADLDWRISQEIILGLGGGKALPLLGYDPAVWHMNEGHAAFLVLENIRAEIRRGQSFHTARANTRKSTVFTTHTPVPAGHDVFPGAMIDRYFHSMREELSISREEFLHLGTDHVPDSFSMSALAMRTSGKRNGVSELHGEVSREMWSGFWSQNEDVPIDYVTNGVHTSSWLGIPLRHLLDQHLDPDWWERMDDPAAWEGVDHIPDHALWEAHGIQKHQLLESIAQRAHSRTDERSLSPEHLAAIGGGVDPEAMTIGFARRFTGYKRPNLILSQPDRMLALLDRGVQIVFAGKAHPKDTRGIEMLQELYVMALLPEFAGRLVVLEGYDLALARLLVQGVDLWLNTPRRPNEASGTSGQKAALNGVLNCSILDGWWPEGFNGRNGWAIGTEESSADPETIDRADADSLYEVLEGEVIPIFYSRVGEDNLPLEWIGRMRESIRTLGPQFNTRRMVREYIEQIYTTR